MELTNNSPFSFKYKNKSKIINKIKGASILTIYKNMLYNGSLIMQGRGLLFDPIRGIMLEGFFINN